MKVGTAAGRSFGFVFLRLRGGRFYFYPFGMRKKGYTKNENRFDQ